MGVTNYLFAAVSAHLNEATTVTAADVPGWIGFECQSMAGYTAATNAFTSTPGGTTGLQTHSTTRTVSTTTQANDTLTATYTFTALTTAAVYGHVVCQTSTPGNFLAWYAYAGVQNLASGDTLAATIQLQTEVGV
jgi:hypothetical protein